VFRFIPASLALLVAPLAHAVEEAEPPAEPNTMGIVVFVVIVIACFGLYGWYTFKNEKKSEEEKLGDKF
jgi:hypothetical protein